MAEVQLSISKGVQERGATTPTIKVYTDCEGRAGCLRPMHWSNRDPLGCDVASRVTQVIAPDSFMANTRLCFLHSSCHACRQ
jgi:hypothetical protein